MVREFRPTGELPSTFVISITPFNSDYSLDEEGLRAHLRRMGKGGVGVYLAGSGSSEGHTLSKAERRRVLEIAVEELKGVVPIRAMGCEPHTPEAMIEYVKEVDAIGLDAVHIYPIDIGHGAKPNREEMLQYYDAAISATQMPVILSSHHSAGYLLPSEVVQTLIDRHPQVRGLVCAVSNLLYMSEMVFKLGGQIEVHCGGPANGAFMLSIGGAGFLSNESNFAPHLATDVINAFKRNDMPGFRASYSRLIALHEINGRYGGSSMRAMKPLLTAFGLPGGQLRPPRLGIDEETTRRIVSEIKALGVSPSV